MIYGLGHFGNVLCVGMLFRCNVHSEALSCCKKFGQKPVFACHMSNRYRMARTNLCERYCLCFRLLLNPRCVLSYFIPSACTAALIIQNNSHTTCHIISNWWPKYMQRVT